MARNIFGAVIDDAMLDQMPRYHNRPKTQEDRAREAMRLINEGERQTYARDYVQSLKDVYGNGVTALCVMYNGTGDTLHYAYDHNWYGHIGPAKYPTEILNGQWASFLHVHSSGAASGCEAALVYRGRNKHGSDRDFIIAWDVPWSSAPNKAYCDVAPVDNYRWNDVRNALSNRGKNESTNAEESHIDITMGGGTSPSVVAHLSIPYGG